MGKSLRKRFLENLPNLDRLVEEVKEASRRGYLIGLDGRKLFMRKGWDGRIQENKALNVLLQSAGAIVMKTSMVLLDEMVRGESLDVLKVIDMHDEAQADVHPKDVERYMELSILSIVKAGELLGLKVPLAAEAKQGKNWAETH